MTFIAFLMFLKCLNIGQMCTLIGKFKNRANTYSSIYIFKGFVTYILKVSLISVPFSVILNPNKGIIFTQRVNSIKVFHFFICYHLTFL